MNQLKENVTVFNSDVESNEGYKYTTNAMFSSVVANKRITDAINELIPEKTNTIIDIGCGDGTYTHEIKKANSKIKVIGTDPATNAIAIAKKKYSDIEFFDSNIYKTEDFIGKQFDLAIYRGVIHHLSEQELAIKNTFAFANSLIILEPNGNNFVLKLIEKNSKYHIEHQEQSFSTKQLSRWCKNSGWKIEQIKYISFIPFFFPETLSKIILFFQPFLEKIPIINKYLTAQIVILCTK